MLTTAIGSHYHQVETLFDIRPKTDPEESCLSSFAKDAFSQLSATLRIDRRITNCIKNPSPITFYQLVNSAFYSALFLTVFKTAGLALTVINVAFCVGVGLGIVLVIRCFQEVIERIDIEYFPKETMLKNISIGVLTCPVIGSIKFCVERLFEKLFEAFQLGANEEQIIARILKGSGPLAYLAIPLASLCGPIFEEYFFRGIFTDGFELKLSDAGKPAEKKKVSDLKKEGKFTPTTIKTMLIASLLFGLLHFLPGQGWMNLSIFLSCTLFGITASCLKELTGDLWAPCTWHVLCNTVAVWNVLKNPI